MKTVTGRPGHLVAHAHVGLHVTPLHVTGGHGSTSRTFSVFLAHPFLPSSHASTSISL